MKNYIDNQLMKLFFADWTEAKKNILLKECLRTGILTDDQDLQIDFGWPSLLEYVDLEKLFVGFPKFDNQNPLFNFLLSTLSVESEKDLLIRLYDQIFVECLTQVKALPQIDQTFLINKIQDKRQNRLFFSGNDLCFSALNKYEKLLVENPYQMLHDLTLYLAWDRVCVNLAVIFEYLSPTIKIHQGLDILKDCLVESFQHISKKGRTTPGFFRFLEALYAYQMRDENLPSHTESEWQLLCQSVNVLRSREELSNVFYIDAAIVEGQQVDRRNKERLRVFTLDSADKVKISLSLAHYMLEKLKLETIDWDYTLSAVEIVCLKEKEQGLLVDTILN